MWAVSVWGKRGGQRGGGSLRTPLSNFYPPSPGLLGAPRVGAAIGGAPGIAQGAANQAVWNAEVANSIAANNNNNNNQQPQVVYVEQAPSPSG